MRESADDLRRLQEIMDRSAASAGPAVRKNFGGPDWPMSPAEFVDFWGTERMASIATVSSAGRVHAAPLEVHLVRGKFYAPTFGDSVRLRDHLATTTCVITSWEGPYRAAIVYGEARVVPDDPVGRTGERGSKQEDGEETGVVTVEITPTRIYAIRPPRWHHAAGEDRGGTVSA